MRARITNIERNPKNGELDAVTLQAGRKTYTVYLDLKRLTRKRFAVNQRVSLFFGKTAVNAYIDGVLAIYTPFAA